MGESDGRWFYKPLYLADDLEIMLSTLIPLFSSSVIVFSFFDNFNVKHIKTDFTQDYCNRRGRLSPKYNRGQ